MPSKVVQVLDDKFLFSILLSILFSVVSFAPPQLCLNAKFRKTGWQSLRPSQEDAETKPPQLTAAIKETIGRFAQFKEDFKVYQNDCATAAFKNLVSQINMMDPDRASILAFLSGSSEYAAASVKILGIFKTIRDEMSKDFADTTAFEKAAFASYGEFKIERTKEVNTLSQRIEEKLNLTDDAWVEIQQVKNDPGDTVEGLVEDKKFVADLDRKF